MNNNASGNLRSTDGVGAIRFEERLDVGIDDLWSALTDRERLAQWYGAVDGELRVGSQCGATLHASGWAGTVRIEACEPPRRFLTASKQPDDAYEVTTEVTLSAEGEQTLLDIEKVGLPVDLLWAFG